MSKEIKQQKAADEKKSKTLLGLLSAAFCKSVTVNLRGAKFYLEQPKYKDVLDIQLETIKNLGDMRKFVVDPKEMKKLSKDEQENVLDITQQIRDMQTVKFIRLCCTKIESPLEDGEIETLQIDELTDEMILMMMQQTGGDSAPIVVAAKKLTGTYDNDLIQDDPFFRRTAVQ